jgi:hypothetical protein
MRLECGVYRIIAYRQGDLAADQETILIADQIFFVSA